MKLRKIYIIAMLPVLLLAACHNDTEIPDNAIVTVYDSNLRTSELENLVPDYYSPEDSAEIADSYIRSWIEKELLYHYAKENLKDSSEISRRVEEYRKNLYRFEIEEQYLRSNLDSLVEMEEIERYYTDHLGDYKLSEPVVKAHYMIMDVKVQTFYYELDKVRRSTPDNMKELYDATKNTNKKIVEHKDWIYLHDLLNEIHTDRNPQVEMGIQAKYFYTENEENRFIVKINAIKEKGDTIPLNLVNKDISRLIVNQRKQDLMTNLVNDLNQDAKSRQNLVYNEK